MSQTDEYQIPTAAFIEHFVIDAALKEGCSLQKASKKISRDFGVSEELVFPLNETRLLGLLYCLLVFPREIWKRDELLDVVLERVKTSSDLLLSNKENASAQIIRGIRNAVAHARVSFDNQTVIFQDQRGDAPPHFDLRLSFEEALNLLLVLGRAFHESAQVKAKLATAGRLNQ